MEIKKINEKKIIIEPEKGKRIIIEEVDGKLIISEYASVNHNKI